MVKAPLVLVMPPVPKPDAVPVVDVATGRQNTPALEIPVPVESFTVPVIVLSVVVRTKFWPVTLADSTATCKFGGGMKVKSGGGGGGAPGVKEVSGIVGPTPML